MDRTFADCLRVGHGYDVHALAPGLRLRLCGVDLEHDRGCVAHSDGDVVIFDPDEAWTVDPNRFASKGRNTPFAGKTLRGKVKYTIVGGEIVYREGE